MANTSFKETAKYAELTAMTAAQLDQKALSGETTLFILDGDYSTNDCVPPLASGWRCLWLGTAGKQNKGTLVLAYSNQRTYHLYIRGQVTIAVRGGLEGLRAIAWAEAKVPYKYELIGLLAKILDNPKLMDAYAKYPGFGPGAGRHQWMQRYNIDDGLSAPRQESLVKLLNICQAADMATA